MNDSVLKGNAPRNNGSSEQDIGDMTFEVFLRFILTTIDHFESSKFLHVTFFKTPSIVHVFAVFAV